MNLSRILILFSLIIVFGIPVKVVEAESSLKLNIPSINVKAPVKEMGLTTDNKMAVPDNYREVGLYAHGTAPKPGDIGNAVMGAHVDNGTKRPTINGVFKNLHKLVLETIFILKMEKINRSISRS